MQKPETKPGQPDLEKPGQRIDAAHVAAKQAPATAIPSPRLSAGAQSGVELALAVIVCAGGGLALDRWMDTAPLFMLLGLGLGFAVGLWNMYRLSLGAGPYSVGVKPKDE